MTATLTDIVTGFSRTAFEAFLESRDEPDWVVDARRKAYEQYQDHLAVPLDPEEWKRVETRTFRPDQFHVRSEPSESATFGSLMQDRGEFAGTVTHVDGHATRATLDQKYAKQGVLFGDLSTLLIEHREKLEPYFGKQIGRAHV